MVNIRIFLLVVVFLAGQCVPVAYQATTDNSPTKVLLYKDAVYENEIKTVTLAPSDFMNSSHGKIPASSLVGGAPLLLGFDDLADKTYNYFVTIRHCNSDWAPSSLPDIDYMKDYNEFRITKYEMSLNTKVSYVHYTFEVPEVKLPGNYLLVVYRDPYKDDYILSKRFVVFDNRAPISLPDQLMGMNQTTGHAINFDVRYAGLGLTDPLNEITATLIQNGRWDNAIEGLRPTFIRDNNETVEFRFFDHSNRFPPGNEFRYFGIESITSPGVNVRSIDREASPVTVGLATDKPKTGLAYSFHRDLNGGFKTVNYDANNTTHYADYLKVRFSLNAEQKVPGDVYVLGELANWGLTNENKMVWDAVSQQYVCDLLLKQGFYNYQYYLKEETANNGNYFEGDHVDTENRYEVLVYMKRIGDRGEPLIGYFQFGINERPR